MQTRNRSILSGFAALGVLATTNAGCGHPTVDARASAASAGATPIARVTTVMPKRMTVRRTTEEPGQIEAAETTPIYAKLAGYVEQVGVDIGDRVKKGQVLAVLRMPEVEAQLRQMRAAVRQSEAERKQRESAVEVAMAGVARARAKVQEIQSGIRRTGADLDRWRAEFTRVEQLFRERASTGSLLDETRSKVNASEAGHDEMKAQVQSAEAALVEANAFLDKSHSDLDAAASRIEVARFAAEQAQAMERYTRIAAPYDGVVTRRNVDTGHLTTPGAGGELLFIVARSNVVTISVGVPETDAPFVNPGDPAQVRLQVLESKTFEGKVTRTAWALDAATRTLRTEIDLANPADLLRPGLYAYATIIAEQHDNVLTLPATAVLTNVGRATCMVVEGGHAREREVKLGLTDGKRTEVVTGIQEGDKVVEANASSLTDGQSVDQADTPEPSPKTKS